MTKMYTIYLLTNTITQKQYVGVTSTTIAKRWISHKSSAKRSVGNKTRKLLNSIRKHGTECWVIIPLCSARGAANAAYCEKLLIAEHDTYNNGYNSSQGGELYDGYDYRPGKTVEQRIHLSNIHRGKSYHPGRNGPSNPRYGKPGTMLGQLHTEHAKEQMKQAWNSIARKQQMSARFSHPVSFDGVEYPNKTTAVKALGFSNIPQLNKYMDTINGVLVWKSRPPKWWPRFQSVDQD